MLCQSEVAKPLETTMQVAATAIEGRAAVRTDLAAIFVSLELSRSKWLITSLSPGAGQKMSKFIVPGGDVQASGNIRNRSSPWVPFVESWMAWYSGTALGLVIITPFLLSWTDSDLRQSELTRDRVLRAFLLNCLL